MSYVAPKDRRELFGDPRNRMIWTKDDKIVLEFQKVANELAALEARIAALEKKVI